MTGVVNAAVKLLSEVLAVEIAVVITEVLVLLAEVLEGGCQR